MEKFLITDTSTKVVLLYHSLYKILTNISKYGFPRVTVKEMFQFGARNFHPHLSSELDKTDNIYAMVRIFQSSLFGFTEHKNIMDSIKSTHRQPTNVLSDFIMTLKRKLMFLYLLKYKQIQEEEANVKAETFILSNCILFKYLDRPMQENHYA